MVIAGVLMPTQKTETAENSGKRVVQTKVYATQNEQLEYLGKRLRKSIAQVLEDVAGDVILAAYVAELDRARAEAGERLNQGQQKKKR